MIIIDENVDHEILAQLKSSTYEIFSIQEQSFGITDREIIELAKEKKGIILTEDKDFGELVFAHKISNCSVIFLRYNYPDCDKIIKNIFKVLEIYYDKGEHFFITITATKIRIRKI